MADEVDFFLAVGRPEVDIEDEHAVIDVIAIHFFSSSDICNDKANTRRRSNGTSVLISKTAHSRTTRLLHNMEFVSPSLLDTRTR
jgi:hypothetical protein